jgi:hypothetical protein
VKPSVVHCKKDAYDVYIGRGSKWGNPYVIGKDGNREEVIAKYEKSLTNHAEIRSELKGKTLGCWCKPKKCHGDILLEIANDLRSRKDLEVGTFLGKYPSRIKGAVDSVRRSGVTVSKKVSTLPM